MEKIVIAILIMVWVLILCGFTVFVVMAMFFFCTGEPPLFDQIVWLIIAPLVMMICVFMKVFRIAKLEKLLGKSVSRMVL